MSGATQEQITEAQQKGYLKVNITAGDGKTKPQTGQKVSMHYVGRLLDGSVFDSSRKRGKPFEFTLGVGQVIAGWDKGVAEMTLGEKAYLICSHPYAYGLKNVANFFSHKL